MTSANQASDAQLRQCFKMGALGRLVGGVAHDFNNMLMVIQGFADFLKPNFTEDTPEARYLSQIQTASEQAASLARQLLLFSQESAENPESLVFDNVAAETVRLLERIVNEDIDIDVKLESDEACIVADRIVVMQVLMNLVANARDAMPDGGTVFIETVRIHYPFDDGILDSELNIGPYVRLTISDSGIGIDDDVMAHIYEPFFTTKEESIGNGLGLSSVYRIVKHAGGNLVCKSRPESGTQYAIYFPIIGENLASTSEDGGTGDSSGEGEKLLIVEDDPAVRALLSELLRSNGYDITMAVDGENAWDQYTASTEPFDLILTDVVMPRLNGQALVSRIIQSGNELPHVVFLSGYSGPAISPLTELTIPWTLITKPVHPRQLLVKLRHILNARTETEEVT